MRRGTLRIGDLLRRSGRGWVIAGTDDGLASWSNEAIGALRGGQASFEGPRARTFPILEVSVHSGFTGQRNVFLLAPEDAPLSHDDLGQPLEVEAPEED